MTITLTNRRTAPSGVDLIHEACALHDTGLTATTIQAMTGLDTAHLNAALNIGAGRGVLSRIDGRWIAWPICGTCGYGTHDRHHTADHPQGVCETHPVDYCAGYPLTEETR